MNVLVKFNHSKEEASLATEEEENATENEVIAHLGNSFK